MPFRLTFIQKDSITNSWSRSITFLLEIILRGGGGCYTKKCRHGSINSHGTLLGKSYASHIHLKLKKERKSCKNVFISGDAGSLKLHLRGRSSCSQEVRLWTLCMLKDRCVLL